jgi:hypothetical protein
MATSLEAKGRAAAEYRLVEWERDPRLCCSHPERMIYCSICAADPSDHFGTSTANTKTGGSPFAWEDSCDDKNHHGDEKTGEPGAPAPQSLTSLSVLKNIRCDPL